MKRDFESWIHTAEHQDRIHTLKQTFARHLLCFHWMKPGLSESPKPDRKGKKIPLGPDDVDLAAGNSYIYLETRSLITRYLRAWAWRGRDPFKREPVTLEVNCPQTVGEWRRINK